MNRITTIIGAGAILDFEFGNKPKPTSQRMLDIMLGKDTSTINQDQQFINCIYEQLVEAARQVYNKSSFTLFPNPTYDPHITFEELFDTLETMLSYSVMWTDDRQKLKPYVAGLLTPNRQYNHSNYYSALRTAMQAIMKEVNNYDQIFRENPESETWYRKFWKNFNGCVDIFTLNYDTTLENSLGEDYEDGFVHYDKLLKRFSPLSLMKNERKITTINHLHGCILYSDIPPLHPKPRNYEDHDLFKYLSYPGVDSISYFNVPYSQSGEALVYCPIITGLHKTDKICYLPHTYYHANLSNSILNNPSILIVGYSFGDIYLNQLLMQHKLIHGDKQRIIIIDYWQNKDGRGIVYHYYNKAHHLLSHQCIKFIKSLLPLEGTVEIQKYLESLNPTYDYCYDITPSFRIYTNGFKHAVINYQNNILEYLQSN